jgi:hypothetical protein
MSNYCPCALKTGHHITRKTCWLELLDAGKIAMLQSSKKALLSIIIQENALIIKSKDARQRDTTLISREGNVR